jgi:hypothetical protein
VRPTSGSASTRCASPPLPVAKDAVSTIPHLLQIPDGKPENVFAFSGEAKNKKYATEIITECNEAWKGLISGQSEAGEISLCVAFLLLSPSPSLFSRFLLYPSVDGVAQY